MIKAVIFDLDDTLISEKQYIKSGYGYISNILDVKIGLPAEKVFRELLCLHNENSKNVFNRLLEKYDVVYSDADILQLVKKYRNHRPEIKFYDDVRASLGYLKSKKIKTGIITDGYANAQRQKLKAVKAYDYFDEIIITDDFGREFWKPHPKSFEEMRNKLGVGFSQMIYVGDNPEKDFYISEIFPVRTVRILRGGIYKDAPYFKNIKEKHLITGLDELSAIVCDE